MLFLFVYLGFSFLHSVFDIVIFNVIFNFFLYISFYISVPRDYSIYFYFFVVNLAVKILAS